MVRLAKVSYLVRVTLPAALLIVYWWIVMYTPDLQTIKSKEPFTVFVLGLTAVYAVSQAVLFAVSRLSRSFEWRTRARGWTDGLAYNILPFCATFFLWEIVGNKTGLLGGQAYGFFFPSWAKIFYTVSVDRTVVIRSIVSSLQLLLFGFAAGSASGIVIGLLVGMFRKFRDFSMVLIRIIGALPATALIPITAYAFPTIASAAMFILWFTSIWPSLLFTIAGVLRVKKVFVEAAESLGASKWTIFRSVVLQATLPAIFQGLFIGFSVTATSLVVVEMIGGSIGVGWYINWGRGWGDYSKIWAGMLLFSAFGVVGTTLILNLRNRLCKWQRGLTI